MVAGSEQGLSREVIRTQRLELVDDQGRVQIVLEAEERGPTFTMLDPESGTPRAVLRAHANGASLQLPAPDAKGGDPLVVLDVEGDHSSLHLLSVDRNPVSVKNQGGAYAAPRVSLDSDGLYPNVGGHIEVRDPDNQLAFEAPLTTATLQQRITDRIRGVVMSELSKDDLDLAGCGLEHVRTALEFAGHEVGGCLEQLLRESAAAGSGATT